MSNSIIRSASILNISINETGAQQIARCSRGTPRVANRLLRRVRDYAEVIAEGKITAKEATKALEMMEVDSICQKFVLAFLMPTNQRQSIEQSTNKENDDEQNELKKP